MSTLRSRASLSLAMLLPLLSCGGPRVLPPEPKVNPSPKQRYEITLVVHDPPAPFRIGDVWAQMDIPNLECVPLADRIAGYRPNTSARQSFEFTRTGENTYVGYIYADYFLPENYYDQGICRWKITTAHADILMAGLKQWVFLDENEIVKEGSIMNFCRRPETMSVSNMGCLTPVNQIPGDVEKKFNYFVVLKARKAYL